MRLVKLSVQRFQCIESADVDFAPGLNILYGPNDSGKSSLAWALRAVLLLQHNSSQHERFVSWYGGGEAPRVALTFTDAENRYWRVSKTFGGATGRSRLEVSKDGLTFSDDGNARQVDEKVRKMLGWGINAPGGQGGPRGVPDTFLIQVLLAEQDDVRKVLLESSLGKDPNESGRLRLTAALGALAQDPLFKRILTAAQARHDKAFTATGRRRISASSPFVEIDARIKELEREHEELQAKVRDTAVTETRIRELTAQRDDIDRELRDGRDQLAAMEQRLAVQRQRDSLRERLETHEKALVAAAELQQTIEATQRRLGGLQQEAETLVNRAREATVRTSQCDVVRDEARKQLEDLTRGDTETDRQREQLAEAQLTAQEVLHEAQRDAERATATLKLAHDTAVAFKEALAASATAAAALAQADDAASRVSDEAQRVRQVLAEAEQRLRDATSDDNARARDLRRAELHNHRLTLQAERAGHAEALQGVAAIKDAHARMATAETTRASAVEQIGAAKQAIDVDATELARLDAMCDALIAQERYGQLRQHRQALSAATRAAEEARQYRKRAAELRDEEALLRARASRDVPSGDTIAGLRALRDDMRIAEATLEVGLAVTVRPKRPIGFHAAIDGAEQATVTIGEPVTLTGKRTVAIQFDDLVELEISAGEESVRARASVLRARWESEGVTLLHNHQLNTLEELETLRVETDVSHRTADDWRREAETSEQRAEQLAAAAAGTTELSSRIAELEQDLGTAALAALDSALDRMGTGWQTSIKQSLKDLEKRRSSGTDAIGSKRQQLARLEAQLEVHASTCDAAARDVSHLASTLPYPAALEASTKLALEQIDHDLARIERALASFAEAASDEESTARNAVAAATRALEAGDRAREEVHRAASRAREVSIQHATRVDEARRRAGELDTNGVWRTALVDNAALSLDHWQRASADAEQRRLEAKSHLEGIARAIDELATTRAAALKAARESLDRADAAVRSSRSSADDLVARSTTANDEINQLRIALADMRAQAASANLEHARPAIQELRGQLDTLGPVTEIVEAADVADLHSSVSRREASLREAEQELAKARGALEQVGGAIVRERQRDLAQAIEQARAREREIVVEYDAWKMLVETMKTTESAEGAHLGRALGAPVTERFRDLTGGRYGTLELGPHLESNGIHVAGQLREIGVLSAGTQDQLATLLRICVAEQLRSSIVLDDHLSQSDPDRVCWFNSVLRSAAKQIQIVFITCRPTEFLKPSEVPSTGDAAKTAAAGQLHAIDLTQVIHRFAEASKRAVDQA